MQQRQLRLGDILDDYCPRERRVTNHAVVAMVGPDVKQTRCTTCDTEHEYKNAKVPRQRRRKDTPAALYSQVASGGPKRVAHDPASNDASDDATADPAAPNDVRPQPAPEEPAMAAHEKQDADADAPNEPDDESDGLGNDLEEGPVQRPLIRSMLPR